MGGCQGIGQWLLGRSGWFLGCCCFTVGVSMGWVIVRSLFGHCLQTQEPTPNFLWFKIQQAYIMLCFALKFGFDTCFIEVMFCR